MPLWFWQIIAGTAVTTNVAFIVWVATNIIALKTEVEASKRQLALVPLAAIIQSQLLSDLHHEGPGFAEPDALIDKFKNLTINKEELVKLGVFIEHRMVDVNVSELERRKAEALHAIMKVVVIQEQGIRTKIADKVLSVIVGLSVATLHTLRYWR